MSPSIVEPSQRQKEMLKETVDRQGWVRRRRQPKPAPRDETPDGAVGRELFPDDDAEDLESSQTEEVEEEPDVKILGAKRVPKAPPPRAPEAPRSRQAVSRASPRARGSVREVMGPTRPAMSAAAVPRPGLAAAAAAEVPCVRTPPRAPSRRSGDGSAACSVAGSQGVPSRRGMEPPPKQAKFKATLNQDEILQLVQKWEEKQGMFEDYVTRPCSIHILMNNRVECLNVISGKLTEPEKRSPISGVFMVERVTAGTARVRRAVPQIRGPWLSQVVRRIPVALPRRLPPEKEIGP